MAKNILSTVSLVPLLLYLILISENASAYKRIRPFLRRHHGFVIGHYLENKFIPGSRMGRSVGKVYFDEDSKYPTSCGERVCSEIESYLEQKIEHNVNKIMTILKSRDPAIAKMKDLIQPGVGEFLLKTHHHETKHSKDEHIRKDFQNCAATVKKPMIPREVFIEEDSTIYYIVNIPSIPHIFDTCLTKKSYCKSVKCTHKYREVEFLVVPKTYDNYHYYDFRVKKVPIDDGCACSILPNENYY